MLDDATYSPYQTFTQIPTTRPNTPLLDSVHFPQDLKQLTNEQLKTLANELRHYLLYCAGQSGGHFGANLGVVELTIAIHKVFDAPTDKIIWDVGHQAYAHKVLTGRREQLASIRSKDGLTSFPDRQESVYDSFGVGHSSTAISAGLGMALANAHKFTNGMLKQMPEVVCIVGDGAMSAGMAFEAMNDAVQHQANMLVILNDNDMSISNSTGGFSKYLTKIWHSRQRITINHKSEFVVEFRDSAEQTDAATLDNQLPVNLFEAIGFHYVGPYDGHDVITLQEILSRLKNIKAPVLLHVHTVKGKGFIPAENDPVGYHAIKKLHQHVQKNNQKPLHEVATKIPKLNSTSSPTHQNAKKYAAVFGEFICDTANYDRKLMAITPAMCEGSGMVQFAKEYPQQFFDVAIAEQHAVTLSGGMACEGLKPIVAIYSTFLQRGYDQLVHDIALQNLDVTFAIDRSGLVGEDGATHAGVYDYAFMRCLPNMVIMAPKDENECYRMLHTAYHYEGTVAVRYPRGYGVGSDIQKPTSLLDIGVSETVFFATSSDNKSESRNVKPIALLAFGSMVSPSISVAKQLVNTGYAVRVVNMRFIKPLDTQIITTLAETHQLVTLEEHVVMGGAGSAVNEFVMTLDKPVPVLNIGLPDINIPHGSHAEQMQMAGIDEESIYNKIMSWCLR